MVRVWHCINRSVIIIRSRIFTSRSKNVSFFLLYSWANLRLGWNFFKLLRNPSSFSWPRVQMKKMSSMYLNLKWLMLLGFRIFRFNLIHEDTRIWWCKCSSSDSISWNLLFNFSRFSQLNKTVNGDLLRLSFFRASFNAIKSSLCGILGYSPTISAVTSIEFFERFLICLIFPRKSPESLMYDQLLYITGFKLLKSFLYILGRKYNFLK